MAKISVKKLESLTPSDTGTRIPDDHSLYGLVKARGTEVSVLFRWRYRFEGKHYDFTCGTWPSKSLKEIRDTHDDARQLLRSGRNPVTEKHIDKLNTRASQMQEFADQAARIESIKVAQARLTVRQLFEHWMKVDLVRRKDGGSEVRRMLEKDVLPTLGTMAVEDVRKGHISLLLDPILERGANRMAKVILSLVRQMFRFAVDRDIIEQEPTSAIRKARIGGAPVERERVLTEDEIRLLYKKLPEAELIPTTRIAIWLCLATGCRIGELIEARWESVRLTERQWYLQSGDTKNKKPIFIYLSDFAIRQFETLKTLTDDSPWCFPNRKGASSVCKKSVTKQIGDRQRPDRERMSRRSPHTQALILPGGKWGPHDLRRTTGTLMTSLGVLPDVADKCLNHKEPNKMKRIYLRHNYEVEKRQAWKLLGERLEFLTSQTDNVILGNFRDAVA
jgi:integrase